MCSVTVDVSEALFDPLNWRSAGLSAQRSTRKNDRHVTSLASGMPAGRVPMSGTLHDSPFPPLCLLNTILYCSVLQYTEKTDYTFSELVSLSLGSASVNGTCAPRCLRPVGQSHGLGVGVGKCGVIRSSSAMHHVRLDRFAYCTLPVHAVCRAC